MIKRKKLSIALVLILFALCFAAFSLWGCTGDEVILEKIEVSTLPKTEYLLGESLDVEGGRLKATYTNGTVNFVDFTDEGVSFSTLDKMTAGVQFITVRYDTKATGYNVTVRDEVESVTLVTPPVKTDYIQDEPFRARGITVRVDFVGGVSTTVEVTDTVLSDPKSGFSLKRFDSATVGASTAEIRYEKNGAEYILSFGITVKKKTVTGFNIIKIPSKTNYKRYSDLELSEAKFRVAYDNNVPKEATIAKNEDDAYYLVDSDKNILEGEVEVFTKVGETLTRGFDNETLGSKSVIFRYQGNDAYGYNVAVVDKEIKTFEADLPEKLIKGTPADKIAEFLRGGTVTLTYTDEEKKVYAFPEDILNGNVSISGYNPDSSDDTQRIVFAFGKDGEDGNAAVEFAMVEKRIAGLSLLDSGDYDLSGGELLFYTGDVLSAGGFRFALEYDNMTRELFSGSELNLRAVPSASDAGDGYTLRFDAAGDYAVAFDYLGMASFGFRVTVKDKTLSALTAEKLPSVTEYSVGDKISLEGLTLRADYVAEDGGEVVRSRIVKAYPDTDKEAALTVVYENSAPGRQTVTLRLEENGIAVTAEFSVYFKAVVTGIELEIPEDFQGADYVKGEKFNPDGLIVVVSYDGAENERVTLSEINDGAWKFSPEILSSVGKTEVVVSYMGKQASLTVDVHNEIASFRFTNAEGVSFYEGETIGKITVGLDVSESLRGAVFTAIRENGEEESFTLPSDAVTVDADNGKSWEQQKTLEVKFVLYGKECLFLMERLQRAHDYYELSGTPKELQTASAGFDATGLILTEFFDNGTRSVLIPQTDYRFSMPEIVFAEGADRAVVDVSILLTDGSSVFFRYGGKEVDSFQVTFFKKIAREIVWKDASHKPADSFKIDQGTARSDALAMIAGADTDSGEAVTLTAVFSDGTTEDIALKDHLEDFSMEGYDPARSENHAVSLYYRLGADVKVDLVVRINPKELYSVAFSGYLIGAQGATEENTAVEGTDLDYSHAYLEVRYYFAYADGSTKVLDPVTLPVQKSWSDFDPKAAHEIEKTVKVTFRYEYRGVVKEAEQEVKVIGKEVSEANLMQSPKNVFVEGEDFTFLKDGATDAYGVLRVAYNNGTFDTLSLDPANLTTDPTTTDPAKFCLVSNGLTEYFNSVGGYQNAELSDGNSMTFTVNLRYMGKDVAYQVVLKDRAYVDFYFEMTGTDDKIYGDAVGVKIVATEKGEPVAEGLKKPTYRFVSSVGAEFMPTERGYSADGKEYAHLPAGNYEVVASFDGEPLLYNPAEKTVGGFTVSKKRLILGYQEIPSVVYGGENPDFIANYFYGEGFAEGESLADLKGFSADGGVEKSVEYVAYLGGVAVGVPKNANAEGDAYLLSVTGLYSDNYSLVYPGEDENPFGIFRIEPLKIFIDPEEATVEYGSVIPIIRYTAYLYDDQGNKTALPDRFRAELSGAPDAYYNGVSADGQTETMQPNVGRYELNAQVMRAENPNFDVRIAENKFVEIKPAALSVEFRGKSVTYGDELSFEEIAANLEVTGWKRNDEGNVPYEIAFSLNGGEEYLSGADLLRAVKNAGSYTLRAKTMIFENYTVGENDVKSGTLTVLPRQIVVTPDAAGKEYGTEDPVLTYRAEGLLKGDSDPVTLGRAAGENVTAEGYEIVIASVDDANYAPVLSDKAVRFLISRRELVLSIEEQYLSKEYDGYAPSVKEYNLTLLNGGAPADETAYIAGASLPDREKIILTFSSLSPDKTSATNPLTVSLLDPQGDPNHTVILAANYRYAIKTLPVEIEWLKISLDGTRETPLEYNGAYPYIYGQKHFVTARVKTDGLSLNPDREEDATVGFSSAFDQYFDRETGYYGFSAVDTYSPEVTRINNTNFAFKNTALKTNRLVIRPNTVYVSLSEAARTKEYDRATASVDTRDPSNITIYEREKDEFGKLTDSGNLVEISGDYKTAVARILNFKVGNKQNGVSDVQSDGYPVTMTISDPTLGSSFLAEFYDEESQKYYVLPRSIVVTVAGAKSKVYDGGEPFIGANDLSSSAASYVTAMDLQGILTFTPVDANAESGDVGEYEIGIDATRYGNYTFSFAEDNYRYTISKKEIYVALSEGSGYYDGERQLTLTDADVKARDNNLGRGDSWEEVFPSLVFSYDYLGEDASLKEGNTAGERGNVGAYTVTLDETASVHKNYTFRWSGSTEFTVKPAEVSILPDRTSIVYGDEEGENAVYRTAYKPSFVKGSDGTSDGSVFLSLSVVAEYLKLDRSGAGMNDVGYYNVSLSESWRNGAVDGVRADLPNYRVALQEIDGMNRFQIVKRALTVKIADFEKPFGDSMTDAQIQVVFPNIGADLRFGDTIETILSGYSPVKDEDGVYRFTENLSYRYTYLGSALNGNMLPTERFADATREEDGAGGVYGYETAFTSLPNIKNYEFRYAEDGKGIVTVKEKELSLNVSDFDRTYREEWKEAAEGEDETRLNFGEYFTADGKIAGDPAELKLPKLDKEGGFADALNALITGDAGTEAEITAAWFDQAATNSADFNRNYVYSFEGIVGTARVVKAELLVTLATDDATNTVEKVYGTLPNGDEVRVEYAGFRGEDREKYASNPKSVIQSEAQIPTFVKTLSEADGKILAELYAVGEHRTIVPNIENFNATNYTVKTPSENENPFTFRVSKKEITVRSAPTAGGATVLKKFYGTPLSRGIDYEVTFEGFVKEVVLPDGRTAAVADDENTVFFGAYPNAEWVAYETAVNVVKNDESGATEIAPNVGYMNEVSQNYQVAAIEGESLGLLIYNKIASFEVANGTDAEGYYAFVAKSASGTNAVKVKVSYLNGETLIYELPLDGAAHVFETDAHAISLTATGYDATALNNLALTLIVTEDNALVKEDAEQNESAITADQREIEVTVRNVLKADQIVSKDNYAANFVGTPIDARGEAREYDAVYNSASSEARFNLAEASFLLMRTAAGGIFDVVLYNARSKTEASYRYVLRFKTDSYGGYQSVTVLEEKKNEDGSFTEAGISSVSIGGIDVFDEASHTLRVYLNKLTNALFIELDGAVAASVKINNGDLEGSAGEAAIGFRLDKAFGYITKLALTVEGYSDESAVRLFAKGEAERVLPLGLESEIRLNPADYFAFLWNYSNLYYAVGEQPEIRYLIDGAETELYQGRIALSAGTYAITAKAYRGASELSSATVFITVVEGYYVDEYLHYNGDGVVDETVTPTVNTPAALTGGDEGRVYEGKYDAEYSRYRLDFDKIDFGTDYTSDVFINVKSNDPTLNAFTVTEDNLLYTGLSIRVRKQGTVYTTQMKLVAGDGNETVRSDVYTTTAVDWTVEGGVYSVVVSFDKKNLYVKAEFLFNGRSLYRFNLSGKVGDGQAQDAETSIANSNINDLTELKRVAPLSWAISKLANLRARQSVSMPKGAALIVRKTELDTLNSLESNYVKTVSETTTGVTNLTNSFVPYRADGVFDSMTQTSGETAYMLGENGFAEPNSQDVRANVYEYATYGVRFKANPQSGMSNKLRFILAENAPKTSDEERKSATAKAARNISLTFIRRSGQKTKLFFSFNDAVYNTNMELDEIGEVKNFRYEQEVYSFEEGTEFTDSSMVDLFDGNFHTVVVTFDKKDNNVEITSGLVNSLTLGNYINVYIDGVKIGGNYFYPAYNNVSPWYYTDEQGNKNAAASTKAPFYDRYFLDNATSAGISFRGLDVTIEKIAVSQKEKQLSFLND